MDLNPKKGTYLLQGLFLIPVSSTFFGIQSMLKKEAGILVESFFLSTFFVKLGSVWRLENETFYVYGIIKRFAIECRKTNPK